MGKNDLIGSKFDRWTVVDCAASKHKRDRYWLCQCNCGKQRAVSEYSLKKGMSKSCGCLAGELGGKRMSKGYEFILTKEFLELEYIENRKTIRDIASQVGCTSSCVAIYLSRYGINIRSRKYDILGKRFGKLVVIAQSPNHNYRSRASRWICKCDCGTEKEISGQKLITHTIRSCGCSAKVAYNFLGYEQLSGKYWGQIKRGAKERNLEFNLDIEKMWKLFQQQDGKCALSGLDIKLSRNGKQQTASLDRVDSNKGYYEGNVQWVHVDINKMKNNFPEEKLFFLCEQIISTRLTRGADRTR